MPAVSAILPRLRRLSPWAVVIAWMALIFLLSSQPDFAPPGSGRLRFGVSKFGHLAVFAVLGLLVANAVWQERVRRRGWWAFVLCALYAIIDEIHQALVPGRTPQVLDVLIDSVGALGGIILWSHAARPFLVGRVRRERRLRQSRRPAPRSVRRASVARRHPPAESGE
jgi:VanZ family protein